MPTTSLRRAMADSSSWPSYGRDYSNQRYSPLSQITPASIKDLKPAWHYATGIRQAFEASPVVIDNVMYVSTPAQSRRRARREDRPQALGARREPGDHGPLLRAGEPGGRRLCRPGLYGHPRRPPRGARRPNRRQGLGRAGRRQRAGLCGGRGAGCGRRQGDRGREWRRVRHPRPGHRLRRGDRRGGLALLYHSQPRGGWMVGQMERRPIRSASRCTATWPGRGRTAPATPTPGRWAAARCGRPRRSTAPSGW